MLRTGTCLLLTALAAGFHGCASEQAKIDMVPVPVSGHSLRVAPYEVTIAQWNACVDAGGCEDIAPKVDQPEITPMTQVNFFDVGSYISWYNASHEAHVRLPTSAEWRIISRKAKPVPQKPLFDDPRLAWAANYGQEETPRGPVHRQGFWAHTADGVFDMDGNVWEWTSTCAVTADSQHCPAYVAQGAHEAVISVFVRDSATGGCALGTPPTHLGLRLVSD
jgi:formylglycine-generating enzyme required for sulfatase activity